MILQLVATLLVSLLAFTGIWLIHVRIADAGIVDYYWGPGFAVIALVHMAFAGFTTASGVLTVAVIVWSTRLSWHLIARHRYSAVEDARYTAMRSANGRSFWWKSLFTVFLLQGFLAWIIASPLHVVFSPSHVGEALGPLFVVGLVMFVAGFVIESVADLQLATFKNASTDSGRLMTSGLWSLCRHPNYLGEIILWFGIGVSAWSATHSLLAFVGPVILALVMYFVSIPLTDDHLRSSRPTFGSYAARTSVLFPRLVKLRRTKSA
jgi:steroid 5-alpha reductase family enzyme